MIHYEGTLYRPPSERASLIIQATIGCSNHTCAFCSMYLHKTFRLRPVEDVVADLTIAREEYRHVDRIFLADGDALIMPMKHWNRILNEISVLFPECSRITCYGTPKSVLIKSPEELGKLKDQGLSMVYMGLESGSDQVLQLMKKGNTSGQIVEAAQKLHEAHLRISVTAINGLGGKEYMGEHGVETGRILSAMRPEYIGLLTLLVEPGTELSEWVRQKQFTPLTPGEILQEIRVILEYCDCPGSIFRANHASNYLPLAGTLNQDKEMLLTRIDQALGGQQELCPDWLRGL